MIMAWTMTPVKAAASAVNYPLADIPQEVKDSVDEAFDYSQENPTERLVIPFADQDEADLNKVYIRSYCLARPAGKLTASIWAGFTSTDSDGNVKFSQVETDKAKTPALSIFLTKYVKRSRDNATADANGQPGPVPPVTE